MSVGMVEALFLGGEPKAPLIAVAEVRAVTGQGLEGDRYARGKGSFSKPELDRHLTLIEAEAIEALARDYEQVIAPAEARRNVLTRGVALNHLVGKRFRVGPVLLFGHRLCEPCKHLEKLVGKPIRKGLVHRGGLRCEVVEGGVIRIGDAVTIP
jgi:MOSC domain-containing protein YiiM